MNFQNILMFVFTYTHMKSLVILAAYLALASCGVLQGDLSPPSQTSYSTGYGVSSSETQSGSSSSWAALPEQSSIPSQTYTQIGSSGLNGHAYSLGLGLGSGLHDFRISSGHFSGSIGSGHSLNVGSGSVSPSYAPGQSFNLESGYHGSGYTGINSAHSIEIGGSSIGSSYSLESLRSGLNVGSFGYPVTVARPVQAPITVPKPVAVPRPVEVHKPVSIRVPKPYPSGGPFSNYPSISYLTYPGKYLSKQNPSLYSSELPQTYTNGEYASGYSGDYSSGYSGTYSEFSNSNKQGNFGYSGSGHYRNFKVYPSSSVYSAGQSYDNGGYKY